MTPEKEKELNLKVLKLMNERTGRNIQEKDINNLKYGYAVEDSKTYFDVLPFTCVIFLLPYFIYSINDAFVVSS